MKKTFILSCFLVMTSICAIAQLTIDSLGVIRTYPPFYINSNSTQLYSAIAVGSKHSLCVRNNGAGEAGEGGYITRYGLYVSNYLNNSKTNIGIMVYPKVDQSTNANEYGIVSYAGNSSYGNYAVSGALHNFSSITIGAGILGSSTATRSIPIEYNGRYAGFFNGNVRVINGVVMGVVVTPSASLSMRRVGDVEEVRTVSDVDVSERLSQVQLLEITREVECVEEEPPCLPLDMDEESGAFTKVKNEPQKHTSTLAKKGYSLDTDQLCEVYPELVYEDQNGNMSINYIEMIPLLVQAINELKAEVEELKKDKK